MRNTMIFLLGMVVSMQAAATSAPPSWLVGQWQFGEHAVWIRVDPKGAALQCRIAPQGTVYKSAGIFVPPASIHWEKMWGTDVVSQDVAQLIVHSKGGDNSFHRSGLEMSPACVVNR